MKNLLYLIFVVAFASLALFLGDMRSKPNTKNKSEFIYNNNSQDCWGGSEIGDTLSKEFKVKVTEDYVSIEELKPNSIFFTRFVKNQNLKKIILQLNTGSWISNEYWASVVNGENILQIWIEQPCSQAIVKVHEKMVRLELKPIGWSYTETYYFYPSN